jgi:predicted SnoaL-like aldol condensation-catalyzing enzyme
MKKLVPILLAGSFFFASCNNNADKAEAKGNPEAEKNLAAVHGINKAIETGDVSKLGDYIAADAIDHSGEGGDLKGLDSIKAHLAMVKDMGTDMKAETIKEFADSNTVIQWMRYTGVCKMPMGAMPAGSHYDMVTVHVSKFKDGKATEHWEFMTMADMMKMMPPPPMPMPDKK